MSEAFSCYFWKGDQVKGPLSTGRAAFGEFIAEMDKYLLLPYPNTVVESQRGGQSRSTGRENQRCLDDKKRDQNALLL
jgi:hypothetical protein